MGTRQDNANQPGVVTLPGEIEDAYNGAELAIGSDGRTVSRVAAGNVSGIVCFGQQEVNSSTYFKRQNVGRLQQQHASHIQTQNVNCIQKQIIRVRRWPCADGESDSSLTDGDASSQKGLCEPHYVNPEIFHEAIALLEENRRVVLCGPPKSGKTALGQAIVKHYVKEKYTSHEVGKLTSHHEHSLKRKRKHILLVDGGLGVVRADKDQYSLCQNIIHNSQCLLVLTAYPHILRDLLLLDEGAKNLLSQFLVIDLKPYSHDACATPTVDDYLPLMKSMLHDPTYGHLTAPLLAVSMLERYILETDPPELLTDLQRLGFPSVNSYNLKQLAYILRGSILADSGPGFASRVLYDAAGLALSSLHSLLATLKVCDVTFLVQYVRTTREESCDLVVPTGEEREVLMQRMYEMIVDGQLPELCQHPSLTCPSFLDDFKAFCSRSRRFMKPIVNAVDKKYDLPLLYWSVWSLSSLLTEWCLAIRPKHAATRKDQFESILSALLATVLLREAENAIMARLLSLINNMDRPKTTDLKLNLAVPYKFQNKNRAEKLAALKADGLRYLNDPSLPIPATLLSVTVTEDAVSVELPSQHWYLALRLLADREVDETDRDGNTLLHQAAQAGKLEAIMLAVESGASVSTTNKNGHTAYQVATKRRKRKTARAEVAHHQLLADACRQGDAETLLLNIDRIQHTEDNGDNLLHTACRFGQTELASILIRHGIDVNARNKVGITPLHCACMHGIPGPVQLLINHRCDVNAKDEGNNAALHYASVNGHRESVAMLIEQRAHINAQNYDGVSALHMACVHGYTETVRLLVKRGATVSMRDKWRRLPADLVPRENTQLTMFLGSPQDTANDTSHLNMFIVTGTQDRPSSC
ncbi:uncharacterized protein [Littorina saxatilis]|uniref:Novel STAND NTPase 3 domain-containing protein n=1 Tax=Littorina saxatilis TaxID=31220 RepID=A0AAN9G3S8_9CAEN